MRARRWGRVLFMSSVAAFTGGIGRRALRGVQAGLHGLTHYLARRLAPCGVTVNAIAPALIAETGMLPADPATCIVACPSDVSGDRRGRGTWPSRHHNAYVTNQVLSVDGGTHPR